MKKIKGELTIKAFTDGRNTKVVVTGPKDITARQLGSVSLTGMARCHEGDYEDSWIGLCIALGRALQVSKEDIEKLSNALCKKKSLVGAVYKNLGMITREQTCPNGKVICFGLRFKPKREVLGRGCVSESWGFDVNADEIKDGDITRRKYEIIEREAGQPPFCGWGSLVFVSGGRGLGFLWVKDADVCLVRLLDDDKLVRVDWECISVPEIAKDFRVRAAEWKN